MYLQLYKAIKQHVACAFGMELDPLTGMVSDTGESPLKDIQWFNNQYEGVIHAIPALFVEFGELSFSHVTKTAQTTPISIRLHVVSEVMSDSDGEIRDDDVAAHEEIARKVLQAMEEVRLPFEGGETRPIRLASWTHNHKYYGWMVTLLGLETKG
ncbi:MAG: hypothetical protein SO287_12910 [Parabacteroides sp.]|nr:hypothetical protein [Parabacteroides sp.]MDY4758459.1 hypothetical protein [Parabacteroides sp.]